MTTELRKAVEHLYHVFQEYPANPNMDGSPMYHDLAQWNHALLAKPLRELSLGEDLGVYYFKAMTTWGCVNDFKHFLPRIFEELAALPMAGIEEWVALGKLNYGKYNTWPELEQAAVHQYLLAFWHMLLHEASNRIDSFFNDYFPAIANVYPDFGELLRLWEAANNQEAAQRLAQFVCRDPRLILEKRVLPGFEKSMARGRVFFDWLRSPIVLAMLKRAVPDEEAPYLDYEVDAVIIELEQA